MENENRTIPPAPDSEAIKEQERQLRHKKRRKKHLKRLFTRKIPIRFGMLLIPVVAVSFVLHIFVKAGLISPIYRELHLFVLLGFWAFTYWLTRKDRHRQYSLANYYICNLCAYGLFLVVASAAFWFNYRSADFPRDIIYYPCFRMSYIHGLLNDKKIRPEELPMSMGLFYGITFWIIMLEPIVTKLAHGLDERQKKAAAKHRRRKQKRKSSNR